jgi:hypothetical protein
VTRTGEQPAPEGSRAGHRSVVYIRSRSQRSGHPLAEKDDDDYVYDDHPFEMESQEGNEQSGETTDTELRRVPPTQLPITTNRGNAWPSSNCSDDWIWSGEPDEQWEQCPIDIPEHMGEEMCRGQGYTFASDSSIEDESEPHPSPSISITSNPMRKRALSESATQTTPLKSAVGHDHRDQMTQWSTPDLNQQQSTEDNEKENTDDTPPTIPLLCNSCWCHWCQRPSEYCGPFSCTSPYIWYMGISREEMNARKLPDSIVRSLVAMGVLTSPET